MTATRSAYRPPVAVQVHTSFICTAVCAVPQAISPLYHALVQLAPACISPAKRSLE